MAVAVFTSFGQQLDSTATPLNGGSVTVYQAGTTTLITLYPNSNLTGTASNPITLDSAGRHAIRYFSTQAYKVLVKDSSGSTIYTLDNIDPGVPVGTGALAVANGGTGATSAATALSNLGGATAAELASLASDVAALSGSLASSEKTHIATGTTAQRPSSPTEGDIRRNTTTSQYEGYTGTKWVFFGNPSPLQGSYKNLSVKVTGNTGATVAADYVATTDGTNYQVTAVNSAIDFSTTGANALDTGTIANTTWYAIWVIAKDDGTTAGLASTSATSPTMPSGYTYKARVGWVRTDGSAHLYGTWQFGRRAQYVVNLAASGAAVRNIANGAAGTYSLTSATYATAAIGNFVPTTASAINITAVTNYSGNATASIQVAPNTSYTGKNGNAPPPFDNSSAATVGSFNFWMLLESTNVAWTSGGAGGAIFCSGWEDNI